MILEAISRVLGFIEQNHLVVRPNSGRITQERNFVDDVLWLAIRWLRWRELRLTLSKRTGKRLGRS